MLNIGPYVVNDADGGEDPGIQSAAVLRFKKQLHENQLSLYVLLWMMHL